MRSLLLIILLPVALVACRKNGDVPATTKLQLHLTHGVGNSPLIFDSLAYKNGAGEQYSISKLSYYLSKITFYRNNTAVFAIDTVAYIDGKQDYTFSVSDIQPFSYDSVSYCIGVPANYNAHGKLAPTYENIAMEWPDVMGGGYHFLKLEGHWKDVGSISGFTVHLGTDPYLVSGGLKASGSIVANADNLIALKMDISEWLDHPHTYSFSVDGVYTMENAALMQKISENGRDVIQLTQ